MLFAPQGACVGAVTGIKMTSSLTPSASPAFGKWNHAVLVLCKHQPTSWCSFSSRGCARVEPYLLLTVHSFTPFSKGVAAKLRDVHRPALGCFSAGVLKETTGSQCCGVRPRFPLLTKESPSGQQGPYYAVVIMSSLRKNVQWHSWGVGFGTGLD